MEGIVFHMDVILLVQCDECKYQKKNIEKTCSLSARLIFLFLVCNHLIYPYNLLTPLKVCVSVSVYECTKLMLVGKFIKGITSSVTKMTSYHQENVC